MTDAAQGQERDTSIPHLRRQGTARHTVIMVQVENEVGMIPEARDHSVLADSLFARRVPDTLMAYRRQHRETLAPELVARWDAAGGKTSGTWEDVFGRNVYTDELFMTWYFARYTECVAAAGKAECPFTRCTPSARTTPLGSVRSRSSRRPTPRRIRWGGAMKCSRNSRR